MAGGSPRGYGSWLTRFRRAVGHAFAVPKEAVWTEGDWRLVDEVARIVVERRLEFAASLWLETHAPLAWSAGQVLHALSPILAGVGRERDAEQLARFLEKPGAVALLLERIEAAREKRDRPGGATAS